MFELTPFGRRRNGITNYNPFRELEDLERSFFSGRSFFPEFKTDIQDKGDKYVLKADLPGFQKDDIHIDLNDEQLTITAERHSDYEQQDEKNNFVRCERSYGSYSRSFDISRIQTDQIDASYENGVLTLTMPKKEGNLPGNRRLDIK